MKRTKGRPRDGGRRPVQVFTCGPFTFHVDRALALAGNAEKYRPQKRWPNPAWVGPFIEVNEERIEEADLSRPVLFATLLTDGRPWRLLIDGNHRVLKAVRHGAQVEAIQLDLADTLRVVQGPAHLIERMRRDGAQLRLLSERVEA